MYCLVSVCLVGFAVKADVTVNSVPWLEPTFKTIYILFVANLISLLHLIGYIALDKINDNNKLKTK